MGQVNRWLRHAEGGYMHWCPGCEELHMIPDSWTFESGLGNPPTFSPSVKITGKQRVVVDGHWTGEWKRDASGNALDGCCHYFLRSGVLEYCGDCTHELVGQKIPLPPLPEHARDPGVDPMTGRVP